jgi:hypothetical protein
MEEKKLEHREYNGPKAPTSEMVSRHRQMGKSINMIALTPLYKIITHRSPER